MNWKRWHKKKMSRELIYKAIKNETKEIKEELNILKDSIRNIKEHSNLQIENNVYIKKIQFYDDKPVHNFGDYETRYEVRAGNRITKHFKHDNNAILEMYQLIAVFNYKHNLDKCDVFDELVTHDYILKNPVKLYEWENE